MAQTTSSPPDATAAWVSYRYRYICALTAGIYATDPVISLSVQHDLLYDEGTAGKRKTAVIGQILL